MLDLPPISLMEFDQIVETMSDEDKKYYCEFKMVHISFISQKLIDALIKKENMSFDEFMSNAIHYYVMHLINERRKIHDK